MEGHGEEAKSINEPLFGVKGAKKCLKIAQFFLQKKSKILGILWVKEGSDWITVRICNSTRQGKSSAATAFYDIDYCYGIKGTVLRKILRKCIFIDTILATLTLEYIITLIHLDWLKHIKITIKITDVHHSAWGDASPMP